MREQYRNLAKNPGTVARREGDFEEGLHKATKQISAEYEVPYLAHAPMETLNCLVDLRADRCEIWTGTQSQSVDRDAAARIAGLNPEQVQIHNAFLGGGFGRRGNPQSDFVSEAVRVARKVKKPVKVIWTREDDKGRLLPSFLVRPDCCRARCERDSRCLEAHGCRTIDHGLVAL
ncbi:MAG: molybdopterin cofactor-binding domain-containing protein [Thermodesulfobacteriota bacterium]